MTLLASKHIFILILCCVSLETWSFLLGSQMTSLAVIPRTEEQAAQLLEFLKNNPQYTARNSEVGENEEQVILVPREQVDNLRGDLKQIGFQLNNITTNAYQVD